MKIHYNNVKNNVLDVKFNKQNDVFNYGLDNSQPSLIEILINMSVTSKACISKVSKSIYGKSFGTIGKTIVNVDAQTLNEVLRIASREYAKHNNVFIHVGYNGLLQVNSIKVLPNTDVRIGKSDDNGYSGKFIIYDNWNKSKGKFNKEDFKLIDKYNPLKNVIESQIENAGSISKYKGQILHIQEDTNSIYSLSDLTPVLSSALLEHNSSEFALNGSLNGFLSSKALTVQSFSDDEERQMFYRSLDKLKGSSNTGEVLIIETNSIDSDVNNSMKIEDLTSQFNDKLFEYSDLQSKKKIALAFNVPLGLITNDDSSLFGNSGQLLKEMKLQLWESREEQRDMLEEAFNKLMYNFKEPITEDLTIINPFKTEI